MMITNKELILPPTTTITALVFHVKSVPVIHISLGMLHDCRAYVLHASKVQLL